MARCQNSWFHPFPLREAHAKRVIFTSWFLVFATIVKGLEIRIRSEIVLLECLFERRYRWRMRRELQRGSLSFSCEEALMSLCGKDNRNGIGETVAIVRVVYSSEETMRRGIAALELARLSRGTQTPVQVIPRPSSAATVVHDHQYHFFGHVNPLKISSHVCRIPITLVRRIPSHPHPIGLC